MFWITVFEKMAQLVDYHHWHHTRTCEAFCARFRGIARSDVATTPLPVGSWTLGAPL